jgi:heme exporter protein D
VSLWFKAARHERLFDAMTNTIRTFLAMGGYAGFVWPAYALAAIVLLGLLAVSLRQLRRAEAELAALGLSRPRERA